MNYLKALLEAREITPIKFSEQTGITLSNIRRLTQDNNNLIETAYKPTQQVIAAALGVTVRDLVKGGKRMKNKILEAEIQTAIQRLTKALRKYSDEGLYLSFFAFTRDKDSVEDGDPKDIPDYYSIRVLKPFEDNEDIEDEEEDIEYIFKETGRIYYSTVDGEEGIRKVIPYERRVDNE